MEEINLRPISIAVFLSSIPAALAHGMEEEGTSLAVQLEELYPLHHFAEGHIFAVILLILLWASFIFALYALVQLLLKKKFSLQV